MSLPNSYILNTGRVQAYFDAILNANPPDRFTYKFLENLQFSSSNDRLLMGVLKELGFIDSEGIPKERYYAYLDRSNSQKILAEGIKEAYSDLFAVHIKANELSLEEVKNKLRTLYAGTKTDEVINRIAKTFESLVSIADFTRKADSSPRKQEQETTTQESVALPNTDDTRLSGQENRLSVRALQYHINIVLPESRDQAVYDAIFKSLREHLG